jgi:protein-disulfide isomerase
MSLNPITLIRPALPGALAGVLALLITACGGANSEEAGAKEPADGAATIEKAGTGALSDMAAGSIDAPVTVIEYASVTCPGCAAFHEKVYPAIKEKYLDTGKVRFIFREFPTSPANLSIAGSMLARCAADKGGNDAYFVVLNALFATQRTWIYGESPREELLKIAAQAGMGAEEFDACVKRQELLDYLNENIKEGSDKYGISSTPSFVLNGQVRHFSSVDDFSKALDEALEKENAGAGE